MLIIQLWHSAIWTRAHDDEAQYTGFRDIARNGHIATRLLYEARPEMLRDLNFFAKGGIFMLLS
jgi:hypothetical protein